MLFFFVLPPLLFTTRRAPEAPGGQRCHNSVISPVIVFWRLPGPLIGSSRSSSESEICVEKAAFCRARTTTKTAKLCTICETKSAGYCVQNLKNSSTSDIHWSTFAAMFFPFGRHVRTNMRFACKQFNLFFFLAPFFCKVLFVSPVPFMVASRRIGFTHSLTHSSISDQLQIGRSFFEVGRTQCRSHKRKFLHWNPRKQLSVSNKKIRRNQGPRRMNVLKYTKGQRQSAMPCRKERIGRICQVIYIRKCFTSCNNNWRDPNAWKGQLRKAHLTRKREAEAKGQVQIWFQELFFFPHAFFPR